MTRPKSSNNGMTRQSTQETPHGMTAKQTLQLMQRFEQFMPGISDTASTMRHNSVQQVLPKGAGLIKTGQAWGNGGAGGSIGGNSKMMTTQQRPYQPEFECGLYNTRVTMADGTAKKIQDIKVGDQVLDKHGHVQTVERHWCSGIPEEITSIGLWGGVDLKFTHNHNFHVWKMPRECPTGCGLKHFYNKRYGSNHFGKSESQNQQIMPLSYFAIAKIPAGEIVRGDRLMIPRKFDEIQTDVTADRARLLGYYIAEGDGNGDNGVEFTMGSHELDTWVADIVTHMLSEFAVNMRLHDRRNNAHPANAFTVRSATSNARVAYQWFNQHGGHSCYRKQLSAEVMRWPLPLKEELIRGMYRGDGSQFYVETTKDGYTSQRFDVVYRTASETLAYQTQLVLAQLGIFAKIKYVAARQRDSGINQSDSWILISRAEHAGRLANLVWGKDSKYVDTATEPTQSHFYVDDDYIYVEVKSVKRIQNSLPVYNMTVSGDHSYLVENIGTYNSPDRQQYPVHRILANRYWRLFYKLDPIVGNCIDMYGDMPWSDFKLTGPGVEGSVLQTMESMVEESDLLSMLPAMVREFFVTGEVCPHLFFDDSKGYWTHIALHNPDQLEVIDAPFIKMDPIVQFIPDDRLRNVITSNNPLLRGIREKMPPQLLAQLQSRQNIPLSPINATFIPRKLHPYDTRGTSIFSRLWRIFMYEDAVFNASIQTARRHAGPIKIAKLGNPQTGWIPGPEHEAKLLQLLAQAELDPHAWLVYHYGIEFDTVGTTDRMMSIKNEWETIERIKLIALGISKSFLHGEVTYACCTEGTHVSMPNHTSKEIQNIKVGDRVVDKDGHIQTVEAAWCEGTPETITEIELWGADTLKFTHNHKFPVWAWLRQCACGCGGDVKPGKCFIQHHQSNTGGRFNTVKLQYVDGEKAAGGKPRNIPVGYDPIQKMRADEIRVGDYLMIPRKFDIIDPQISEARARLLGYYVAEGDIDNGQARWSMGGHEFNTWITDIVKLCNDEGVAASAYLYTQRNASKVTTSESNGLVLAQWLKVHAGYYSHAKTLSEDVMCWPLNLKRELVIGAFRGDGSQFFHNTRNRYGTKYQQFMCGYTTVSESIALQMKVILTQLGIYATIDTEEPRVGSDGSPRRKLYLLKIYGNHARTLADMVWGDDNLAKDLPLHNDIRERFRVDDNYIYVPVRSVKSVSNDKPVYNLTVSGNHSYLANGLGTYNSAATGLQVFLQRLKALRAYFEQKWILPKFFQVMAEINGWIRRSPAEINHRFRVKRSQRELIEENRYIRPKIVWEKSLDPAVDANLINAMQVLESMGCKFSKTTKMATVGMSFEEESHKIAQEAQFERQFLPKLPSEQQQQPPADAAPGGMMGGPPPGGDTPPPPADSGDMGNDTAPPPPPTPGGDAPPAPAPAALHADAADTDSEPPQIEVEKVEEHKPGKSSHSELKSEIWKDDRYGNWHADEIANLVELFTDGTTESPVWARLKDMPNFSQAISSNDSDSVWLAITELLDGEGYPQQDIKELRYILAQEGYLPNAHDLSEMLDDVPEQMDNDAFLVGLEPKRDAAAGNLNGDLSEIWSASQRGEVFVPTAKKNPFKPSSPGKFKPEKASPLKSQRHTTLTPKPKKNPTSVRKKMVDKPRK